MEKQAFMKPVDFARAIDASKSKVYELIQKGEVPHVRIGGMLRIPVKALDHFTKQAMAAADAEGTEGAE